MKNLCQNQRTISLLKKIAATLCFFIIFIYVFVSVTYLFRGDLASRKSVVGVKEVEPLDMIYVGGSAAYCYWEPLKAWNDCGFTSYNVATSGIESESILYYIKNSLKYQTPELFVVGIRSFEYYHKDGGTESGLRRTSDSLDFFDMDRIRFIRSYLNRRTLDTDELSLYLDIMKYHTNYEALSSPESWEMINNSGEAPYMGSVIQSSYYYLEEPEPFQTQNRAELEPNASETLYELLDFCKEKDLNVLFVVCPYSISEEDYAIYNTIQDIVSSYGYGFLNANDYYAEMEFDFSRDFSDKSHVNDYGAEKYTAFLEKYIKENYDLPDHRGESRYDRWNELYEEFSSKRESGKNRIANTIEEVKQGKVLANELCENIEDLYVWCDLIKDPRFTVLAVGDGEPFGIMSPREQKALEAMGLSDIEGDNYIRILCNAEVLYSNAESEDGYEMKIGAQDDVDCLISNENKALSIMVQAEECSRKDTEGINIVVFENDYRYIVDSLTMKCDADGNVVLIR